MNYFALIGDVQSGPFNASQLREKLDSKEISGETFVWCEGMADWVPLQQVDELRDLIDPAREKDETVPAPERETSTSSAEEAGTIVPKAVSNTASKKNSSGGVMDNLRKGAEIARKQAALKTLELTELRTAYAEVGRLTIESGTGEDQFARDLQQVDELDKKNTSLQQPEPDDPNASLTDKARRTATAAKRRAELEANRIKQRQITGDIGKRVVLEGIAIAGTESAVARAADINAQIESLQNEINQIGAGASAWVRHPMLVVAGLAILLGGGFFLFRGGNKPSAPNYAAADTAYEEERREQMAEQKAQEEKWKKEDEARRKEQEAVMRKLNPSRPAAPPTQNNSGRNTAREAAAQRQQVEQANRNAQIAKNARARTVSADPLFTAADFSNLHALTRTFYRTTKPTNPRNLTEHLMARISDAGFARIQKARKAMLAGSRGHAEAVAVFSEEFNQVIQGELIHNEQLFRAMPLSPETKELLAEVKLGHSQKFIPHLNRMLLEDAFPGEIKPRIRQAVKFATQRAATAPVELAAFKTKERKEEADYQARERAKLAMEKDTVSLMQALIQEMMSFDSNQDQALEATEFRRWWQRSSFANHKITGSRQGFLFRLLDADQNGRISIREWVTLDRAELVIPFAVRDVNQDLQISELEFRTYATANIGGGGELGLKITLESFPSRDFDGDGVLSANEWMLSANMSANSRTGTPLYVIRWGRKMREFPVRLKLEDSSFRRVDSDKSGSVDLAEFTRNFGDRVTGPPLGIDSPARYKSRLGGDSHRGEWEDSYAKRKKSPLLSWHELWFVKIDQNADGRITFEEWLGHKNLSASDRKFMEDDFAAALVYVPRTAKIVADKVRATLLYALSKGLVTAQLGGTDKELFLRVRKTDLVKGMDLYLSLQEGGILIPGDPELPRFAIKEFGGYAHRVLPMYARDEGEEIENPTRYDWHLRVVQLDLGKGAPKELTEFTLNTKSVNELGALFGVAPTSIRQTTAALLALAYANEKLTKEDVEVHGNAFPQEFKLNGCDVHIQPYFDHYFSRAVSEATQFRTQPEAYLKTESDRVKGHMDWGKMKYGWDLFTPILPAKLANALTHR